MSKSSEMAMNEVYRKQCYDSTYFTGDDFLQKIDHDWYQEWLSRCRCYNECECGERYMNPPSVWLAGVWQDTKWMGFDNWTTQETHEIFLSEYREDFVPQRLKPAVPDKLFYKKKKRGNGAKRKGLIRNNPTPCDLLDDGNTQTTLDL